MSVEEALRHPTWAMGGKITIDSATLMNKGLELIEAHHLFGTPYERIDVVVHPQSVVHSYVLLCDGAALAHLGHPDMRVPISYALHYPERVDVPVRPLDLAEIGALTFEPVDTDAFPCLRLAREAAAAGGTAPCVLNAANEVAVHAFLNGRLDFLGIPAIIESALERLPARPRARLRVAPRGRPRGARGRVRADRGAHVSWLLAFLGFAALIILHEFGHFAAAKATGMRVERFSLFFPPLLARIRRGETEYAVGAIPLGGYVKITGMSPHEELSPEVAPRAYLNQPPWKRIVVIAAGPAMNLLIAFLLGWAIIAFHGVADQRPRRRSGPDEQRRGQPAAQRRQGDLDRRCPGLRARPQRSADHRPPAAPAPRRQPPRMRRARRRRAAGRPPPPRWSSTATASGRRSSSRPSTTRRPSGCCSASPTAPTSTSARSHAVTITVQPVADHAPDHVVDRRASSTRRRRARTSPASSAPTRPRASPSSSTRSRRSASWPSSRSPSRW